MQTPVRYETVFRHPPERVMQYGTTLIAELSAELPNITKIQFLGEEIGRENRKKINYRFYVKPSLMLPPWLKLFSQILKPFTWKQWFELDENQFKVYWRVDPEGVPAKTHSEGITYLTPHPDGCQLRLEGELFLQIAGEMPGPRGFLNQLEDWLTPSVTKMVEQNLGEFYAGLKEALDEKFGYESIGSTKTLPLKK